MALSFRWALVERKREDCCRL